ncbi:MAG TPA: delta-60 repeat domain-containing protein [Planctomycetota bacterium]
MRSTSRGLLACLVPLGLASPVPAQCATGTSTVSGFDGPVTASVLWDPDGAGPLPKHLVVAGSFTTAGGVSANGIARLDPQTGSWSALGSGVQGVRKFAVLPGGELVAAGTFSSAGGVAANNLAQWNGSTWAPLGAGVAAMVRAVVVTPQGELVVANALSTSPTMSQVHRWDGVGWSVLGTWSGSIKCTLAIGPNGELLFANTAGIVHWTGSAWAPHAPGMTWIDVIAATPDGKLFGAGTLTGSLPNFALWNGATWTPLGPTYGYPFGMQWASEVDFLPNGDLVVCGFFFFTGPLGAPVPPQNVARWNGSAWSGFANLGFSSVYTATFLPKGHLFLGGPMQNLARIDTTCPAQQAGAGAGCNGSGGANVLAVETLPWIGGRFRAHATGLPALSLVSEVFGLSTLSLPLSAVLPQGQPGCDLLVMPDYVNFSLAANGAATTELVIPNAPFLVGATFFHQLNLFEYSPGVGFVAITASNALAMTVGSF